MNTHAFTCFAASAALLLATSQPTLAQIPDSTTSPPPENAIAPETPSSIESAGIAESAIQPNVFYWVQGDRLIKVEETPIEHDATLGAGSAVAGAILGFGGNAKSWMVLAGETSMLQITELQPRFRLMCDRPLALSLRLGPFEVKDGKRRAQVDLNKQIDVFKKKVPVTVSKHAEGVWDFVPEKPLKAGEYAFTAGYGQPVADFTIVAEEEKKE